MAKELDSSSRIRLNIGGKEFCTTVDTLTQREPNSMLAAMFSGRHALNQDAEKGCVFIDRDGQHFRHILNWLRDGTIVPTLQDSEYQELLKEAEYFQLIGLINELRVYHVLMYKRKANGQLRLDLNRMEIIDYFRSDKFKGSSSGRSRFKGANISGLDFSGLDLSEMDFSYTCMKEVDFSDANLTHAKLNHADGEGAIFGRANLQYSEFYKANFPKASFTNAKLNHAKLQHACLKSCSLHSAKLDHADFSHANLEGAIIRNASLKFAKFTNASLKNASLLYAELEEGVDLRDANTEGVKLWGSEFGWGCDPSFRGRLFSKKLGRE